MPKKLSGALRALVLSADGPGWRRVVGDTVFGGLLGLTYERVPERFQRTWFARKVLAPEYARLGYVLDWRDAILAAPELDCHLINVSDLTRSLPALKAIRKYDCVIVLHSAFGDFVALLQRLAPLFQARRGPMFAFVGNEYDQMSGKFAFLRSAGVNLVGSQLPLDVAQWLYARCSASTVIAMPHALNPEMYNPPPKENRTIDVGFIGSRYPLFIGDTERNRLLSYFEEHGTRLGLTTSISATTQDRAGWLHFLQHTCGILGAEAGTYYLDQEGALMRSAKAYCERFPEATLQEVVAECFSGQIEYRSGKAISSRHFEPIGAMACQLLLEGRYNGILTAGQHYIAIDRDLGNVDEAVRQFRDLGVRRQVASQAYAHVMGAHTYRHRVQHMVQSLDALAS